MPRASIVLCGIAFISAALLGVLRFQSEKAKQLAELRLAAETARAAQLGADLAATQEKNAALATANTRLESDLANSQANLAATESRAAQLDRELLQAKAALAVHESNARALHTEIAALRDDLAQTRATFASPETVADYQHAIAELERQLAAARSHSTRSSDASLTATLASRAGVATILSVGPQNAFVVLDFGGDRGARLGQKLQVNHGTDLRATVLISDVRPNLSIAQVLPDTLRGVLQKGDQAILLR